MKKIVKRSKKESDQLNLEGIYQKGYGIIPKLVMQDEYLTIEAKSIYALLCSYAGRGNTAFPSVETQCHYLKISEKRYLKHRKLLLDRGYITIEYTRDIIEYSDGKKAEVRGRNIYTIVNNPCMLDIVSDSLTSQIVSVENVSVQNECKQIVGEQNDCSNNNNPINISSKKNTIENNTDSTSKDIIEEMTNIKLTPYQIKLTKSWEHSRLIKSLNIFNEQNGVYFSLLRKIYYDANNFINTKEKKNSFDNFTGREYDEEFYKKLENHEFY